MLTALAGLATLIMICTSCSEKSKETSPAQKTLRIATSDDHTVVDPRKARLLGTMNLMHLLYQGLYTLDKNSLPVPALAQETTVSADGLEYRFLLKPAHWSDGCEITAQDFVYSFITSLDPAFGAPNAHQLFTIKNAQQVYEKKLDPSLLGIKAVEDRTLVIQLERPNSSFLYLLTTAPFFPVPKSWIEQHGGWPKGVRPISNGPYVIDSWHAGVEMTLIRNKHFLAPDSYPEQIIALTFDELTAYTLFENGELDWIGSPLSTLPPDTLPLLSERELLKSAPAAATYFIRVNTTRQPLLNQQVRQALAASINRSDLVQHVLQGGQTPAFSLVPPILLSSSSNKVLSSPINFDPNLIDRPITLSFTLNEISKKVAQQLQDDWKKNLGVTIQLVPLESKIFMQRLSALDYDLALGSWFADYPDALNFLSVFASANNGLNKTGWRNETYASLLVEAEVVDGDKKARLLQEANDLLSNELPIIPLYHSSFNYAVTKEFSHGSINPLGILQLSSTTQPTTLEIDRIHKANTP